MTTVDPLDIHIPQSLGQHARPGVGPRSSSSKSFIQALNSIDISDKGASQSTQNINDANAPCHSIRRHHSYGNVDSDESPDSKACAALFQKIMSQGINVSNNGRGHKKGSSFHVPTSSSNLTGGRPAYKKGLSFDESSHSKKQGAVSRASSFTKGSSIHTNSSGTTHTIDIDKILSETGQLNESKMSAQVAPAPIPSFPAPRRTRTRLSSRPVEKPPLETPPVEATPEEESSVEDKAELKKLQTQPSATMQVIDLLWHDLRGVKGTYSGQVNSWIQPHGFGSLVLVDGTTITCKWFNGTPLERRRSDSDRVKKMSRSKSNRHSFDSPHRHHHQHPNGVVLDESARTEESNEGYKKSISAPVATSKSKSHPYQLGDPPQYERDMIVPTSTKRAVENVESLEVHDFAFVLRSNGEWCYSIVAKKNTPTENGRKKSSSGEECASILFVTDTKGSTKCIKMKHWGKMIRLVNV